MRVVEGMTDDVIVAPDGTQYMLQNERVRGEGSWWEALRWNPAAKRWVPVPELDGAYSKRRMRQRVMKLIANTTPSA